MNISEILKLVSRILAAVLSVCYFYQIVYLLVPFFIKHRPRHGKVKLHRYAVLIAARNEENVLPYLLDSIVGQDYPRELVDVYVVADNCTDRTAAVAREHGATVYERFNKVQIGKGYALNFLLENIKSSDKAESYDAFLVFDADNLLKPDYITEINKTCSDGYEAFCGYRNSKNFADNWLSAGYALWYIHDSVHLNQSRMLLGTTCAVTGTGFGFTQALLEKCGGWRFFTLTEDIEFDTWCAANGVRIGFTRTAELYDEQPTSFRVSWRQRTRWVQGGIQVSFRYCGMIIKGIFSGGRTSWASFESSTLLVWGYAVSVTAMTLSLVAEYLTGGWAAVGICFAKIMLFAYLPLLVVSILTTVSEWRNINATTTRKIASVFTFPIFMMTYVPIALTSVFHRFSWKPIEHKVAVPVSRVTAARSGAKSY